MQKIAFVFTNSTKISSNTLKMWMDYKHIMVIVLDQKEVEDTGGGLIYRFEKIHLQQFMKLDSGIPKSDYVFGGDQPKGLLGKGGTSSSACNLPEFK